MQRRDDRNPQGGPRGPRGNGFGSGRPNEYGGWDRRQGGGGGPPGAGGGGPMTDKIETTYNVPSTKCGIIIGKGKLTNHHNIINPY